jgi:chromate transporter
VSKRALKDRFAYSIAALAFVAIALLKLPFPLVVLAAALAGFVRHQMTTVAADHPIEPPMPGSNPSASGTMKTLLIWLGIWFIPLALLLAYNPGNGFFAEAAVFFSKAAAVTFGGAYAVLVYAGQQAVEVYGWLKPGEMATGLGLAETTPGPLILVLVFVAFVGGSRLIGLDPALGGVLGGITAMWFTFVPCFLWIFAGAPYIERLRHVEWLSASLAAVTAAVVGVIANLAVWFGLHVLFGDYPEVMVGPLHVPMLDWTAFDWRAALIAVASGVALLRFHANLFAVLGGAAAAGIFFKLAG